MSRGINRVTLVGNLGNDPDVRYLQNGTCVTRISVATTQARKDKDGNPVEETSWHRVVFWSKLAEIAGEYLRKGSQVYIEGRLSYGSYEKDGVTHHTTDIVANEMQMLGGRGEGGGERQQSQRGSSGGGGGGSGSGRRSGSGSGESITDRQKRLTQGDAPPMDDFADDDIPF